LVAHRRRFLLVPGEELELIRDIGLVDHRPDAVDPPPQRRI